MNRITREKIKKQREAKGFTGIQIKDLGKFFKRKEMQAPTPSGVTQKKTTTTKPSDTKDTPKPAGQTNRSGGNRAGGAGSNKQGGQETVTPETTTTQDRVAGRKKNQSTGTVSKLNEEATKIENQLKQTGLSGKIKNRLQAKLERIKTRIASLGARGSR
jgi:hypothetical protein